MAAVELFIEYHLQEAESSGLEYEEPNRIDEAEALRILTTYIEDPKELRGLEVEKRNKIINELRNNGLSIRQLSRLTGLSVGVIRRC